MNALQVIEQTLKGTVRRLRLERTWNAFWKGLLIGGVFWFLMLAIYKLAPIPFILLYVGAFIACLVPLFMAIIAASKNISIFQAARFVDSRRDLKERLSTALEISGASGIDASWRDLLVADAAQHVKDLEPPQLIPLRLPAFSRWA